MTTLTTQSSLGLSSLIFIMKINSFVIQPNRIQTRFKKRLLPFLTETLIVMTKSDMITECVALPITVQIGIGSKTTMKRIVRTKSMQKESLGIVVVLRGIMVEINRSRRTIGSKQNYHPLMVMAPLNSIQIGSVRWRSFFFLLYGYSR